MIGASVHPLVNYVSFDFLRKVSYYVLDWLFLDVYFVVNNFERGKLYGGDCFSDVGNDDVCETMP